MKSTQNVSILLECTKRKGGSDGTDHLVSKKGTIPLASGAAQRPVPLEKTLDILTFCGMDFCRTYGNSGMVRYIKTIKTYHKGKISKYFNSITLKLSEFKALEGNISTEKTLNLFQFTNVYIQYGGQGERGRTMYVTI